MDVNSIVFNKGEMFIPLFDNFIVGGSQPRLVKSDVGIVICILEDVMKDSELVPIRVYNSGAAFSGVVTKDQFEMLYGRAGVEDVRKLPKLS